ncbi:MAG: hypothetical protein JHC12_02955 [Thermogladius sp.]|nr:hypothetical protein [Thermogladius sp.]
MAGEIGGSLAYSNVKYVFLNDLATALYGLLRPLGEIRILVEAGREVEVSKTIASVSKAPIPEIELASALRDRGVAAVNMATLPLLVVDVEKTGLDSDLLERAEDHLIGGFKVKIPPLEGLVARLLSQGQYPYVAQALTLLVTWVDAIDRKGLAEALRKGGVDTALLREELERLKMVLGGFPNLAGKKALLDSLTENL